MDKEHVKGAAAHVKGTVKEAVGKVTGNTRLEVEGKMDKVEGRVRNAIGDAKDAAEKVEKDIDHRN